MKVVWTARARVRLRQIYNHIAQDQPLNAERVVDRITLRARQLMEQPRSGRIMAYYQRDDIRELIERPYRIIYHVLPDRIEILTVRDSGRVLPRRLDEL